MKSLECRIPPLAQVLVTALAIWLLARTVPSLAFSLPGACWWALGLAVAGSLFVVLGVLEFRRAQTTLSPISPEQSSTLVTTGVYRLSRNPMYLGFLLLLLGWALYWQNGASLLLLPVFVLSMNRLQILPEERFMLTNFGQQFRRYRERVRRWL